MKNMRRVLALLLTLTMLITMMPAGALASEGSLDDVSADKLVIEAANVTGKVGDIVEVPINITENPGVIGFGIEIEYDADKLSLKEMPAVTNLIGGSTTYSQYVNDNPFAAIFDNGAAPADITATGTLMVMKFEIKADAVCGDTPIKVSFRDSGKPINFALQSVPYETKNGSVTVAAAELPVIEAGKVSGYVGQTVEMTVDIKDNPGIIAAELNIDYDSSKLKLVNAVDAGLLGGYLASQSTETKPYYMSWMEQDTGVNNTQTGTLATLSFEILDGCAVGDEAVVTVNVKSAKNADLQNVSFAVQNGIVTVTAAPGGTYAITVGETANGTVTADKETAAAGETVTLTVTPDEGYELDTLTVNGEPIEGTVFTMPAEAVTVLATFKQSEPGDTEGKLVIEAVNVTGKAGDIVEVPINITENPGVIAFGIEIKYDADKLSLKEMPEVTNLIGGSTTYSEFVDDYPFVALFDNGAAPADITETGTLMVMKFEIKADAEYGDTPIEVAFSSTGTPINFDMDDVPYETKNGIVTVAVPTYAVTVGEITNGTVTADKETAQIGDTVTLTVTPAEGYKLDTITVTDADGAAVTVTDNTFTMPAKDVTISATFKKIDYTVTVGEIANGTVTADKETAQIGDTVTLTVTPAEGYKLDTVTVNGEAIEGNTFTMPAKDVTISATFKKISTGGGGGGGSSSPFYQIVVEDVDNGDVTVSSKSAKQNTTVTLTVTPDDGYKLDELTVTDKNGKTIKLTNKGDGKYTFTMPVGKVTVDAAFVVDKTEAPVDIEFTDVEDAAYYAEAVKWAVENAITTGTSSTTFNPNAVCTRAQVVTFLWRAAGSPEPTAALVPFTDVAASAYYYDAVLWAVENGITNGLTATTFGPNADCTRGQIVTFLWRSQGSENAAANNPFVDVADDAYYTEAVLWAVENDITNGLTATTFGPDADCTRGQIVTFLWRCLAE